MISLVLLLACSDAPLDSSDSRVDTSAADDTAPVDTGELGQQIVEFSHSRGLYQAPITLTLSSPYQRGELRFTLDGRDPVETGVSYQEPLEISATTLLRVVLLDEQGVQVAQDTHSYLFLDQVGAQQAPEDYPSEWWTAWSGGPYEADYTLDPEVMEDPEYAARFPGVFSALPVVSIVVPPEELFGRDGIHDNPVDSGSDWERAAHVELFWPEEPARVLAAGCGLRIAGGTSRKPSKSPKKSFRVSFKSAFGPTKLEGQLFEDADAVQRFDTLVLRARYNRSWVHFESPQRERAAYVREQLATDLQRATGAKSTHTRSTHLFINGLYWGLYLLQERPDEHFLEEYYDLKDDGWDVLNQGEVKNGSIDAWQELQGYAAAGDVPALQARVDVPALFDYVLLNLWLGNNDWNDRNWYGSRHADEDLWRFYAWDNEITLIDYNTDIVSRLDEADTPGAVFLGLMADAEMQVAFGDQIHKRVVGGVYSSEEVARRWTELVVATEDGVLAESARWGDHMRDSRLAEDAQLYTPAQRQLEHQRVLEFLPQREQAFLEDMQGYGWYPSVEAPVLELDGEVRLVGQAKTYYSVDGADPRLPGGELNPDAVRYLQPFTASGTLRARTLQSGEWSALLVAELP